MCGLHDSCTDVFICLCARQPPAAGRRERGERREEKRALTELLAMRQDAEQGGGTGRVDMFLMNASLDKKTLLLLNIHSSAARCSNVLSSFILPFSLLVSSLLSSQHHMFPFKSKHGPVVAECHRPPGTSAEAPNVHFAPLTFSLAAVPFGE